MTAAASRTAGALDSHGLVWTEYGYLLAAMVAAWLAVNPLEWDAVQDPVVIRHLALLIAVPAMGLTFIGRKIAAPGRATPGAARLMRILWPLLMLAAMITGGSFYARLFDGVQNTFMNVGLYMLMTLGAAWMVLQTDDADSMVRAYFRILLLAAVVMSLYLIVNFRVRQVYHEQIFLVIPMAALFFARDRRTIFHWVGCIFFLSMAWFSQKYTSYLIGAFTVVYCTFMMIFSRLGARPALYRATVIYWVCALGALAAILLFFASRGSTELPSGNLEYRLHTYATALGRFTDSPLWGTAFTAEAVEKFTLYSIGIAGNVLPTHSDILDLLAHGGVIALLLWTFGLARIGRTAFRNLLRPGFLDHRWAPYAHALALMSLAGIITYAFNPILLQPAMAYLLWTNLGLLLGLSLRARAAEGDRMR